MLCCYKLIAEEICSYVDLCFQSIYTDATMNFFDRSLIEGTQASARKDNAYSSELMILFWSNPLFLIFLIWDRKFPQDFNKHLQIVKYVSLIFCCYYYLLTSFQYRHSSASVVWPLTLNNMRQLCLPHANACALSLPSHSSINLAGTAFLL